MAHTAVDMIDAINHGLFLQDYNLKFHPLYECQAYVYLAKDHPLATHTSISFEELSPYPCLSFEQGETDSSYLAEEILSDHHYPRTIKVNDRATMLNFMHALHGYTLFLILFMRNSMGKIMSSFLFMRTRTIPIRICRSVISSARIIPSML